MRHVSVELQHEIEQFLYHEARLLQEGRFRAWLDLLADDIRYWMPVREAVEAGPGIVEGPGLSFALFDDDKRSLMLRVQRLETGLAHAEIPVSVTQRLITNVQPQPTEREDEVLVDSHFLVYQVRRGRHQSLFVGERHDRLRRVAGGWNIAGRRIVLAQSLLPATLSIFF